MLNRVVPRIEPCGTPCVIKRRSESALANDTNWFFPCKQVLNHSSSLSPPRFDSLLIKIACSRTSRRYRQLFRPGYAKPNVAIFNIVIFIQFNPYSFNLISILIQFNPYLFYLIHIVIQFNPYSFNSICRSIQFNFYIGSI